ncbi:MAG: methanol dehydrogenase [Clostridiales bacterium]|nr:methanol dehydrogenase [Clostridiales bacterium]
MRIDKTKQLRSTPRIQDKLTAILLLAFVITTFLLGGSLKVKASENERDYPHVYDEAGLLSTSEIMDLEEMCMEYGSEAGIEIMILTHNDSNAKYAEEYLEDFNDTLPDDDRVLLLLDMHNRVVFIEGYGLAETYIHSKRIDAILDDIVNPLSNGAYYDAMETYIKSSAAYKMDDSELNWDHDYSVSSPQSDNPDGKYYDETWPYENEPTKSDDPFTTWWFQLIVSLVIGGIAVGIMAYSSGGKMTAGSHTYLDQGNSGLIGRRDLYLRTKVTRVRRPKDNSSSGSRGGFNAGGFRGGVSSGGRSHSSGGRKF